MYKKNIAFITITILLFSVTQLFPIDPKTQKLATTNNDFGFRLFKEIVNNYELQNVFISPASIAMALAMTYNGASGETKKAMAKTLGIEDWGLQEFNEANLALKNSLAKTDPKVTVKIANSLWTELGMKFKKDFIGRNKKYYGTKVTTIDMNAPRSPDVINAWVKDNTNGKITKIVDQIDGNTIMFLINAVYFNGKWQTEFDSALTQPRTFYCADGKELLHPMMYQDGEYLYLRDEKFQAVSLPYGKGQLSMYIFLPNKNSNLEEFLENLNEKNWSSWISRFTKTEGDITLPRFKLEYEKSLSEILKAMGMEVAFNADSADFSNMCKISQFGEVYIGDVKHKTFVDVNEEGTEAAAITSVVMEIKGAPMYEFSMVVDHPFFCSIVDNKTGSILFMGVITEPK